MTLNKMIVIGNVGTDPEMRYTPNGNPVTSFRLATNRRYTTSEGEQRDDQNDDDDGDDRQAAATATRTALETAEGAIILHGSLAWLSGPARPGDLERCDLPQ